MRRLLQQDNTGLVLPKDLIDRGFRLIVRSPTQMFAVSKNRGGTVTSATIEEVITNARAMAAWCEWMDRKQAEKNGKA